MAFDPKPSTWLGAGYALDGTNHLIKLNTDDAASNKLLQQLTDALANPTTGDIRNVIMATCEAFYQAWNTQLSADRPTKMLISRGAGGASGAGLAVQFNYTFKFTVDPTSFSVSSE